MKPCWSYKDCFVIIANISAADSALRLGARVTVEMVHGDPDRVMVRGLSRGGRRITKFTSLKRLKNIRPAWAHETASAHTFASRDDAQKYIDERLSSQRQGDPP